MNHYICYEYNFSFALGFILFVYGKCSKISNITCRPKRPRQTGQTQIRLLLKKQSDQGLACLLFLTRILWIPALIFNILFRTERESSLIRIFPVWYSDKNFVNSSPDIQHFIWKAFKILEHIPYCSSLVSILCFSLTSTGDIELSVEKLNKQNSLVDYGGHYTYCCLPIFIEKLKKGLGKRIHQIQLRHDPPQTVRYLRLVVWKPVFRVSDQVIPKPSCSAT